MTPGEAEPGEHGEGPGLEDPTRFGGDPDVEPLDEAPDGHTPMESNDTDDGSLPPGAHRSEP